MAYLQEYDGYCGLYCGACPLFLETKATNKEDGCYGCRSEHPAGHCLTCGIKKCAQSKGYAYCSECAEMETCKEFQAFRIDPRWPYHLGVLKNFAGIQKIGREAWLRHQETRWKCSACGASHSWWDETCPKCGGKVQNYSFDL